MSTITRAKIFNEMKDRELVLQTLKELNLTYHEVKQLPSFLENADNGQQVREVNNSMNTTNKPRFLVEVGTRLFLAETKMGIQAFYNEPHSSPDLQVRKLLVDVENKYQECLQKKIQLLKEQAAESIENKVVEQHEIELTRKRQLEVSRERLRLETLQQQEKARMEQKRDEKVKILENRGKDLGYNVQILTQGTKKVIVFARTQ